MIYLFPLAQIILSIGACVIYAVLGDWLHAVYWGSAAVITASVTAM